MIAKGTHISVVSSSVLPFAATQIQPRLTSEFNEQHQTDVDTLYRLIEESPHFKTVTLALQRAHDFPTDQQAFQNGQSALKSVWHQTLLSVNLGGVNEMNTTLLKKVFKFEKGVLAIDSSTDQPVFAQNSSDLITDVVVKVLAAAVGSTETVPETETMRLMRSAFGQSDAEQIQFELVAVSSLDEKIRLAFDGKVLAAVETLSKVKEGSVAAHIQLKDELQHKLSEANKSAGLKKKRRVKLLKNIDGIDQAFSNILIHANDLDLNSLINAADTDSALGIAFDAIEEHFKRLSETAKVKLGEINILDELNKQLQIITHLLNGKEHEIEEEMRNIVSLNNKKTMCESNIISLKKNQATAITKRDEANQELQRQKSLQEVLKQVGRHNDEIACTKTISEVVINQLRSSIARAANEVNKLRAACAEYSTAKDDIGTSSNCTNKFQRERQTLSMGVENASQNRDEAVSCENMKLREFDNEADRVKDGKSQKENPNKKAKENQYHDAVRNREEADRQLAIAKNGYDQNERDLVQSNADQTALQQRLDSLSTQIIELCGKIRNMINSQKLDAISAGSAAQAKLTAFQNEIDDAKKSIDTNTKKKTLRVSPL